VGGKSWGAADSSDDDGSSDDDEQQQQQQQKGRSSKPKSGAAAAAAGAGGGGGAAGAKGSLEMTVTFTPGLEKLGSQLLQKRQEEQQRKGDSVWDAYLRCVCFRVG